MHVTCRAMPAAAALRLTAAGGAPDHEIPGDRSARDILPAATLKGANYKVCYTGGCLTLWV